MAEYKGSKPYRQQPYHYRPETRNYLKEALELLRRARGGLTDHDLRKEIEGFLSQSQQDRVLEKELRW